MFKLPIEYNESKINIGNELIDDLELITVNDDIHDISGYNNSLYGNMFKTNNKWSQPLTSKWCQYYTNDILFLQNTQTLLKQWKHMHHQKQDRIVNDMHEIYHEYNLNTQNDNDAFHTKYQYIKHKWFQYLNNSSVILQLTSMYNLGSPILSLLIPFIMLLIPFFILNLKGISITVPNYVELIKSMFKQHTIHKLFTEFGDGGWDKRFFLIMSVVFYVFQIYNNTISCYTFYKNIYNIQSHMKKTFEYIDYTSKTIQSFINLYSSYKLKKYKKFIGTLKHHRNILKYMKGKFLQVNSNHNENDVWGDDINKHPLFGSLSMKSFLHIGHLMSCFYQLYNHKEFRESLHYTLSWHGYLEHMTIIKNKLINKEIHFCKYYKEKVKSQQHTYLKQFYYPLLKHLDKDKNNLIVDIVKNDIHLGKNILITGTNASGKSTLLKSVAINILLSQQFGCGYYDKAKIKPYNEILSYINIPDTSQRDSLFQAESRRCKHIIDRIEEEKGQEKEEEYGKKDKIKDKHRKKEKTFLCIFDELYSGTNPDEAIASAISYIDYLSTYKNVNLLLTTHFVKCCSYFEKTSEKVTNKHMAQYKIKKGISRKKGGLDILKQLNYPNEIIQKAHSIISL